VTSDRAEKIWKDIWSKTCLDKVPEWDELANVIFSFLNTITPSFVGKNVLEAGSGTGRISLRLAQLKGARVVLIDVSRRIVKYSLGLARHNKISADFVVASIFNLPIKSECLDIVWSAGVLEHFSFVDQQGAISEFMRCLDKSGKSIVIVPNRGAFIYNWSRVLSMKLGKWSFGYEEPLSRNDMYKFHPTPRYVRSTGFFQQFFIFSVPYVSVFLKCFLEILHSVFGNGFYHIDRILPGYLLISTFVKG